MRLRLEHTPFSSSTKSDLDLRMVPLNIPEILRLAGSLDVFWLKLCVERERERIVKVVKYMQPSKLLNVYHYLYMQWEKICCLYSLQIYIGIFSADSFCTSRQSGLV